MTRIKRIFADYIIRLNPRYLRSNSMFVKFIKVELKKINSNEICLCNK